MITITVDVDGNSVSRDFNGENDYQKEYWGTIVESMLETIGNSNKPL